MWSSLAWVVLLLALFGALAWWLRRRFAAPEHPDGLVVRAARRLDGANAVWVVEVERRRFLLGSGREGVRLLAELSPPEPPA